MEREGLRYKDIITSAKEVVFRSVGLLVSLLVSMQDNIFFFFSFFTGGASSPKLGATVRIQECLTGLRKSQFLCNSSSVNIFIASVAPIALTEFYKHVRLYLN